MNGHVTQITDILDNTDTATFWGFRGANEPPRCIVQLTRWNKFTAFVDGRIDTTKVTETRRISQSIEDLRHTNLVTRHALDSEITGGKRAFETVFNGGRLDDFIHVRIIDDTEIVLRRTPRPRIDFSDNLFRHILHEFVEIIPEEVIQECAGEVDALVQV